MFLPWFLAYRFIFITEKKSSINVMIKVCFWGILISTFSLTLVTAIMRGFEEATHKKLQGIHADLIISAHDKPLKYDALKAIISQEFPEITAQTPQSSAPAMLRPPDAQDLPILISIMGINPATEKMVTTLSTFIQQPAESSLESIVQNNHVLIGSELAEQLHATIGIALDIFIADEENRGTSLALEKHSVIIGGIFKTGIDEFDSHGVYCASSFFKKLFPERGVTTVLLKNSPNVDSFKLISRLKGRFNLSVYSWKDLYPALVSALVLEKYAMFFILALICLIATMNIISLLFMYITQKTEEIVLLKTIGIPYSTIITTFMIIGITVAATASLIGLGCAVITSWLLEKYPFITLPDVYYVTHLPAHIIPQELIIIFALVMILSVCATWIPTRRIKTISVSLVLKKDL